MNEITVVVHTRGGKVFADSRAIAEAFGKQHQIVLRDIRKLDCSSDFRKCNFVLREEIQRHSSGATKHKVCEMTQDGTILLIMSYGGEKAAAIKEAYIAKFNEMAATLASRRETVRGQGKRTRVTYTGTLRAHGVEKPDEFRRATNASYLALWDKDAAGLRKQHGLPDKANVRDHMGEVALAAVMLTEAMASDRISTLNRWGVNQCVADTTHCGNTIRKAISDEKKSRKLIGAPG